MNFDIIFYVMLARLSYKGYNKDNNSTNHSKLIQRITEYLIRKKLTQFTLVKIIEKKELLCYILRNKKEVYIVFRGTLTMRNWGRNINIRREKIKYLGKIHKGFYNGAKILTNEIKKHINKDDIINMSSHSLGSTLSLISSNLLYKDGYTLNNVVCFESPNFANDSYISKTENYKFNRIIFTNNVDLVSVVPIFLKNYPRIRFYFDEDNECFNDQSGLNIFIDRIFTLIKPYKWKELLTDHSMSNLLNLCYNNRNTINEYINEGIF